MGVIFKVKFTLNIVCLFTVRIFSSQDLFIFGNIFFLISHEYVFWMCRVDAMK